MNNKLKQIIFGKLYDDLKHVEIIQHEDSIWFIDRKEKYWYFEYEKSGKLWWRWDFFNPFFAIFSTERKEYEWIVAEWVEEVLNCKVEKSYTNRRKELERVEEVLNYRVEVSLKNSMDEIELVEEVLNCKVEEPRGRVLCGNKVVYEVLNNTDKTFENEE
jgi:hypothetical protein